MEYRFKCCVDLGSFCWGGGSDYEECFTVDISDDDAEIIRSQTDIDDQDVMSKLSSILPDVHNNILCGALSVVEYASVLECRESGLWRDAQEPGTETADEDELMEYDMEYRGFDPVDKNGKPLPFHEARMYWVEWEKEQLKDLPIEERTKFYIDRYNIPDGNTDLINYEIVFPEELKGSR